MTMTTDETLPTLEPTEAEQLRAEVMMLREKLSAYRRDTDTLGEMLCELADEHDLCSKYEDAVERINARITSFSLPTREVNYNATIEVTVSYSCRRDAADDMVRRISLALYRHGDNLGDESYEVTSTDVRDWDEG